jgi:hypothetical protein
MALQRDPLVVPSGGSADCGRVIITASSVWGMRPRPSAGSQAAEDLAVDLQAKIRRAASGCDASLMIEEQCRDEEPKIVRAHGFDSGGLAGELSRGGRG